MTLACLGRPSRSLAAAAAIGAGRRRGWASLVVAAVAASTPLAAAASPAFEAIPFPYEASGADLGQVLSEVGRRAGLVVRTGEGIEGAVTLRNADGSLAEFLDKLAAQLGAVWWHDGTLLHLDGDETLTTVFLDPQGLSVEELERELAAMSLADPRFRPQATSDGAILRVAGPQGYVDQVVALVDQLNAARRLSLAPSAEGGDGLYLPRIYRGRPAG